MPINFVHRSKKSHKSPERSETTKQKGAKITLPKSVLKPGRTAYKKRRFGLDDDSLLEETAGATTNTSMRGRLTELAEYSMATSPKGSQLGNYKPHDSMYTITEENKQISRNQSRTLMVNPDQSRTKMHPALPMTRVSDATGISIEGGLSRLKHFDNFFARDMARHTPDWNGI